MTVKPRLVLASALMLFLELALIRWLGSNVVHLSYFTNFVLLGSFLGIGLGFLQSRRERSILPWSPWIVAALVGFVHFFPVQIDRAGNQDIIYFTAVVPSGPPAWLALPVVFIAVAAALMGPAEAVGRCFRDLPPLEAYRLDLVGSIIGIAAFTALSFLRAPSLAWGAIGAACFLALLATRRQVLALTSVACLAFVLVLLTETVNPAVSWSPYYKVTTDDTLAPDGSTSVRIKVNGVPHQAVRSAALRLAEEPQYGLPYERLAGNPLGRVLIVGAGSGSDVAIALSRGAQHVDAVEIDPRILQIGRERHPNQPYSDPRVRAHVNDGRAFLEQSDETYDLILFALPDSLALVTGASAIRLESYLFTREAIEAARSHLSPGGGFAMYNYYREDWLIDRLGGTVADVFGHEPCLDRVRGGGGGQAVVAAALDTANQTCAPDQPPLAAERTAPATDDRPFLYFRGGGLPGIYLVALAGVLVLSVLAVRLAAGGGLREMRPYADLFFMGAAFLLLETKNITSFALLFGTTWVVNAIVFGGVLVAVLLAVETTRRLRTPSLPVMYAAIAVSLLFAYLVPNSALLGLPLWPRVLVAVAVAFAPIYVANVAFAKRFAQTGDARAAFAVNILGAMVGGCLEYAALLTGYRDLLLLTGLLYLVAFVLLPRKVPAAV